MKALRWSQKTTMAGRHCGGWGGHMAVARLLAGLASSASVMNTQQIPRRLRVGKEDARRFLCNLGLFHATQQT